MAEKKRKKFSKSKRRKRRLAIFLFWFMIASAVLLLFLGGKFLLENVVSRFQEAEDVETLSIREIKESADWEYVIANQERYPEYLLEAL